MLLYIHNSSNDLLFSVFWRETWKFGGNFDLINLTIILAEEPRFDRSPVLIANKYFRNNTIPFIILWQSFNEFEKMLLICCQVCV